SFRLCFTNCCTGPAHVEHGADIGDDLTAFSRDRKRKPRTRSVRGFNGTATSLAVGDLPLVANVRVLGGLPVATRREGISAHAIRHRDLAGLSPIMRC